jgi:hypothetical protein
MTAVLERTETHAVWAAMPGWGIVADLTPPEVVARRQLRVLRRMIAWALVAVVVLCVAGYVYAFMQNSKAEDDADAARSYTTQLQVAAGKFSGVTRIEAAVDSIRAQVASVMLDDVDVPALLSRVRSALPGTMSISNLSVTLTPANAASNLGTGSLDASGRPVIGTVTVTGSGRTLDDLPEYIDRLVRIRGVVNVVPGSNQVSAGTAQFTLNFALNDELYSHRYDVTATGATAPGGH